jgi:hypothetical protein
VKKPAAPGRRPPAFIRHFFVQEKGMRGIRRLAQPLCLLLIVSYMVFDLSALPARAGMTGTELILHAQTDNAIRTRLEAFFQRQEVEAVMAARGVNPFEARERVASLTDAETMHVARTLDLLPAGGDALNSVVNAAVFVFIVLLITDILGLTKVFPFTRAVR